MQKKITLDVYDKDGNPIGQKTFYNLDKDKKESINKWWVNFKDEINKTLAFMVNIPPDFQHNNQVAILSKQQQRYCLSFTIKNLIPFSVYFAVRHAIPANWLNDRDQFLAPDSKWEQDCEFQNDCLAFTLFHGQNRITSKEDTQGVNHFIPFSESAIKAKERFKSDFMFKFINGKIKQESKKAQNSLFSEDEIAMSNFIPKSPLKFSKEAQNVFNAGREIFKYYHTQEFNPQNPYNANVSLYEIKEYFQGRDSKGKLNPPQKCKDEYYKTCLANLNLALKELATKIEPKIYGYGFLMQ